MKPLRTRRDPNTLLGGRPYVPSHLTDIRETFRKWTPITRKVALREVNGGKR